MFSIMDDPLWEEPPSKNSNMTERFKKPTNQQLIEFAILFNEGKVQMHKLTDMVAMCQMVIDRLYDNGDVMIKSLREIEDEKPSE